MSGNMSFLSSGRFNFCATYLELSLLLNIFFSVFFVKLAASEIKHGIEFCFEGDVGFLTKCMVLH